MEGISTISYKNKSIIYIDYSVAGTDKDKILQLIKAGTEEYRKHPPKSVISLLNVANVRFDMDVVNALSESRPLSGPYEKKIAIIGLKGLLKVIYNAVVQLAQREAIKIFESEAEAKEWLAAD